VSTAREPVPDLEPPPRLTLRALGGRYLITMERYYWTAKGTGGRRSLGLAQCAHLRTYWTFNCH